MVNPCSMPLIYNILQLILALMPFHGPLDMPYSRHATTVRGRGLCQSRLRPDAIFRHQP